MFPTFFNTFLLLTTLTSATLFGQQQATLDSLKKEVSVLVYNNPELAIEKGFKLYNLSKDNASYQISALLSIANGYAILKEHDEVFKYALKADSIAEKNENYTDQVRVLGFIGGQYRRLKLSGRALRYLDEAYNLTVKHPLPDSLEFIQGNILVVKGLIKKDDLGCEYALPYFTDAVKVFERNTDRKSVIANLAITLNNIGDCFIELERFSEAKQSFDEAITYALKINAIKNIASSKLGLAKLLSIESKYEAAIENLETTLNSIKNVNDAAINIKILKALSENYKIIGNNEKFNSYTKMYLEEEQKLLEQEKKSLNKVTEEMSSENLEKRINQKNKYTYTFLICGLILFIIIVLILRNILQKRTKIAKSKDKIQKSTKKG
ncbi:hypothetical protein ULMS_16240 [Patiriisocius marinistellae]|uniref:Tetratricopeptide repeat protein n=1 Tax=Patiriisocius marinistellae TaxID=2494560 RepID=A0A5J4G0Y2_9FLAO|nr:tetratricopeptide repeat protein [Patiriisocius marinistellae]GEQ86116.1 hypothetical protein ULMS_16240 [Patiriisocius marinistellae]